MNTNPRAKRILCYGDSNTRGRVPWSMGTQRYSSKERWPGILQDLLGSEYEVIEEGLGGRTTMFDDPRPAFPERNGLQTLPILLETHLPLNLLILMLGTTDTKPMMNLNSEEIGEGMRKLIQTTKGYKVLQGTVSPEILVIVPPIVKDDTEFASQLFAGGTKKGNELIEIYRKVAEEEGVQYFDPSKDIQVDQTEWVHIDAQQHQILARLVFENISNNL